MDILAICVTDKNLNLYVFEIFHNPGEPDILDGFPITAKNYSENLKAVYNWYLNFETGEETTFVFDDKNWYCTIEKN